VPLRFSISASEIEMPVPSESMRAATIKWRFRRRGPQRRAVARAWTRPIEPPFLAPRWRAAPLARGDESTVDHRDIG